MTKLSAAQRNALQVLADTAIPRSAYPGLSLTTLNSLERCSLVYATYGLGSMSFPHTAIKWSITTVGREALR